MNLDRRTYIAVALCVAFLFLYKPMLHQLGWDKYLQPAAPAPTAVTTGGRDSSRAGAPAGPSTLGAAAGSVTSPTAPAGAAPAPAPGASLFQTQTTATAVMERTYALETPLYVATFSNRGARLLSVELKHYASAHGATARPGHPAHVKPGEDVPPGDRVSLAGGPLFGVDLGSHADLRSLANVVFAVEESLDTHGNRVRLAFVTRDSSGAEVRETFRSRPDHYALDLSVEIHGVPNGWRLADYSLTTQSWPMVTEADAAADLRSLRATSLIGDNLHREHAVRLAGHPKSFDGSALWAAVQTRYFVSAVALADGVGRGVVSTGTRRPATAAEIAVMPPGAKPETQSASNTLIVGLPSDLKPVQRFVLYVGPSEVARLAPLGYKLDRLVDLGWSWVQPGSRALLLLLRWLYGVVRNYGFAIILLATTVRLLLHPLNVLGIRNMRAMQRIQPELERIREKYKNDAQALNTAMMSLYKEHGVNPAGGCLPMLVQIPVFIALYNVLFNAIELRQAPFVAWIHDLSAPDLAFMAGPFPVRLMPLLMLGSGLLSQRLTPSDPRQLPTMYLMNAFMTVFFYNLPSGLVLYWTLMNLLTALQQWQVLRQDHARQSQAVVVTVPPAGTRKAKAR